MNARTTAPGDTRGQRDRSEQPEPSEPPEPTNRGTSAAMINVQNESSTTIDLQWLRDHLAAALTHLPRPVNRVDVAVLGEDAMSELHERYQGINGPTDVLTFDASPSADAPLEVDIAVCADVAQLQAKQREYSIERELLLYVIHGLLHCMGYHDEDTAGFAAMHEKEDDILDAIGVGRTFTSEQADERAAEVAERRRQMPNEPREGRSGDQS